MNDVHLSDTRMSYHDYTPPDQEHDALGDNADNAEVDALGGNADNAEVDASEDNADSAEVDEQVPDTISLAPGKSFTQGFQ